MMEVVVYILYDCMYMTYGCKNILNVNVFCFLLFIEFILIIMMDNNNCQKYTSCFVVNFINSKKFKKLIRIWGLPVKSIELPGIGYYKVYKTLCL